MVNNTIRDQSQSTGHMDFIFNELQLEIALINLYTLHKAKIKEFKDNNSAFLTIEEENILKKAAEMILKTRHFEMLYQAFSLCNRWRSKWHIIAFGMCRDQIPDEDLYEISYGIYSISGFGFPIEYIADLFRVRPDDYLKNIPSYLEDQDILTVYRASKTPPENSADLKEQIAWTTNPWVALCHFCKNTERDVSCYIYSAKIPKSQIAVFVQAPPGEHGEDRGEQEILQAGGVYDFCEMSLEQLEIACKEFPGKRTYGERVYNKHFRYCMGSIKRKDRENKSTPSLAEYNAMLEMKNPRDYYKSLPYSRVGW